MANGKLEGGFVIKGKLSAIGSLKGTVKPQPSLSGKVASYTTEFYDGSYEVEPIDGVQTIEVEGYKMSRNITIMPIPSNYGLITWDGTKLTVS